MARPPNDSESEKSGVMLAILIDNSPEKNVLKYKIHRFYCEFYKLYKIDGSSNCL